MDYELFKLDNHIYLSKWESHERIHPLKGLRLGDSLAPFLFVIAAEGLVAVVRKAQA